MGFFKSWGLLSFFHQWWWQWCWRQWWWWCFVEGLNTNNRGYNVASSLRRMRMCANIFFLATHDHDNDYGWCMMTLSIVVVDWCKLLVSYIFALLLTSIIIWTRLASFLRLATHIFTSVVEHACCAPCSTRFPPRLLLLLSALLISVARCDVTTPAKLAY